MALVWEPARKQEPHSYNHKEHNSADNHMSVEEAPELQKDLPPPLSSHVKLGNLLNPGNTLYKSLLLGLSSVLLDSPTFRNLLKADSLLTIFHPQNVIWHLI